MRIDWIRALIYQRPGLDITARVAKTLNYQQSHQNLNHFKVDESWRSNVSDSCNSDQLSSSFDRGFSLSTVLDTFI